MKKMMNVMRVLMASAVVLAVSMEVSSCTSCGVSEWHSNAFSKGPVVTEVRQLKGFEEIEINGSPRVCYTQADSFSVVVKGTQEAVDNILTETKGKTLTIRNRGKIQLFNISFSDYEGLTVYVTSPDLTGVRLNGSGDFEAEGRIDTDQIDIVLRGSGDMRLKDIICDRCDVELIGSGDVSLGNVDALNASAVLVGSGDLALGLQRVKDTRLLLKGSGDIKADFKEGCVAVGCELRGSGDISLKGSVHEFRQNKTGSGDIDVSGLTVK
jgi:hypothetical protein